MLANARKDRSILLYFLQAGSKITKLLTPSRHEIHSKCSQMLTKTIRFPFKFLQAGSKIYF